MVGSSARGWRHSIGERLISMTMVYGVLGREDVSLTSGQTAICLLAGLGVNALIQPKPGGCNGGAQRVTLPSGVVLPHTACGIS